jgi:hypothetical protein
MADDNKKLKEKLNQICEHWHQRKKDLKSWETTSDGRLQYHIVIEYWGSHHARLVFKEKVGQQQAEAVLDPILKKLAENNEKHRCETFATEVDLNLLFTILDVDRTMEANK